MDDHPVDELRMLRERAYGPDADIHDDPAALARLHELEGRAAVVPADVAGSDAVTEADAPVDPVEEATSVEPVAGAEVPAVRAEPEPSGEGTDPAAPEAAAAPAAASRFRAFLRTRRGKVIAAALALFLAAVIGAALTLATIDRHDRVAVLDADPDAEWPEAYFGEERPGGVVYDEFLGLTMALVPNDWTDAEGNVCLYVMETDGLTTTAGPGILTAGCTAGRFDATTAIIVNGSMPDALVERFAEGTALQFVADGSTVSIYAEGP